MQTTFITSFQLYYILLVVLQHINCITSSMYMYYKTLTDVKQGIVDVIHVLGNHARVNLGQFGKFNATHCFGKHKRCAPNPFFAVPT